MYSALEDNIPDGRSLATSCMLEIRDRFCEYEYIIMQETGAVYTSPGPMSCASACLCCVPMQHLQFPVWPCIEFLMSCEGCDSHISVKFVSFVQSSGCPRLVHCMLCLAPHSQACSTCHSLIYLSSSSCLPCTMHFTHTHTHILHVLWWQNHRTIYTMHTRIALYLLCPYKHTTR